MTTLNRYDASHLILRDEELLSIVLDELDIEATSFLHESTINRLIEHKLITVDLRSEIAQLRAETLILIDEKHTIQEIRNDDQWKALRQKATGIIAKVNNSRV